MTFRHKSLSRIFLIRATFPLLLVAILWSSTNRGWLLQGLLILTSLDFVAGIVQLVWQPKLLDYRFAALRDVVYAFAYYVIVVHNPHLSALILFPSALAEVFVLFGSRIFIQGLALELALLAVRMMTVYLTYHRLHPSWAILICTASVIMGLLGLEIRRLEQLEASIRGQQEEFKKTLVEMLSTTLASSGIDEELLKESDISPLLEGICESASTERARELGSRVAEAIANKQEASSLLTARELEVLVLIAEEHSYRQIAKLLQVSEGTVRAHAASLMRKADVHSRVEIVDWAIERQILPSENCSKQTHGVS